MQNYHYDCHGFHESLPKGRASGKLTIGPQVAIFEVGGQKHSLSLHELQVESGGASNRLIFFSHPRAAGWSFYTSDRSITKNPYLNSNADIKRNLSKVRTKRGIGWAIIAGALLLVIAVPTYLLFKMDVVSGVIATQVPVSWEEKLGETSLAQYTAGQQMMPKDQVEELLFPLVEPLKNAVQESRYQYQFGIVQDPTLNAFALPGGYVVIHTGLINAAENAEQLLGVIAHEMIHVEEQHGVRNVIGTAGIYVTVSAILGDVNGVMAVLANAAPLLLNQSYSRRFETEADTRGFELLLSANINPVGLTAFFEKLKQQEEKMLQQIENEDAQKAVKESMGLLSSHPATDQRIAHLNELLSNVDTTQEFQDLSREFRLLKEEVSRFTQFAEEKEESDR